MEAQIQQLQQQLAHLQEQLEAAQPADPPQAPAPARTYKPIIPKSYSGGRNEKLKPWLFQVEWYCEMAPVPVQDQVKFAGGLLEGNPASWWLAIYGIIKTLSAGDQ